MKRIATSALPPFGGTLGAGLLLLGTLGALALAGTSGCDAVARLNFSDRTFEAPYSVGLMALGDSAETCSGSSGPGVMRFVLIDGDGLPIADNSQINNRTVSLSGSDISFGQASVYDFPDDPECGLANGCGECGSNYLAQENLCPLNPTSINTTAQPQFLSALDRPQALAILLESSASISGGLPASISTFFPDIYTSPSVPELDGIGDAVGMGYNLSSRDRASDPDFNNITLALSLIGEFQDVQGRAARDQDVRSFLGVWTFNETGLRADNSFMPGAKSDPLLLWSSSATDARDAARNLSQANASRRSETEAGVFRALSDLLDAETTFNALPQGTDKHVIVIVDGPDDFRTILPQSIIEKARAQDVRIFIIHMDPAVQKESATGTPLIPDSLTYVADQDAPCASDADCKNFEACRPVTAFAPRAGAAVEFPQDKIFIDEANPAMGRQTYCSIQRDANGRIGPIEDYAQIACATGGGYMRVDRIDNAFDSKFSWLPSVLDGLWEVPVEIGAFGLGSLDEDEGYAVETSASFTVGGITEQYSFGGAQNNPRAILFEKAR